MHSERSRRLIISFRPEYMIGWTLTILLCLISVWLWLAVNPWDLNAPFATQMVNLGSLTGIVGTVLYSIDFVLATRLRFLEPIFGGLNQAYIAHHIIGGFSLILLSLHPLFLALRLLKISTLEAATFLLPYGLAPLGALFDPKAELHSTVLQQWALFFGIVAFWGMLGLLVVTFFIKIPYRIWLLTHKFLGLAFFIGGLHVLFINNVVVISPQLRYYLYVVIVIGLIAFVYKLFSGKILIRRHRYIVEQSGLLNKEILQIVLRPQGRPMTYEPGQFVFIRFLGAKAAGVTDEWHPFSISSAPTDPVLWLNVKALGDYTNILSSLPPGTTAEVEGAYGRFSYREYDNPKQIWVGGGIGIAPFLSMARDLPKSGYNVDLYYAVRTPSELVAWDMLANIASIQTTGLRLIPFVSQQSGHLSADYIEQVSGELSDREVFICGPTSMMTGLRKELRKKSVPDANIHTEEFAMA